MTAREGRGNGDPLSHARGAVADPAVEQRRQAQRFMQLSQASTDIIDIPADKFENVAPTQGIRQLVRRRREAETQRASGTILDQLLATDPA